MYIPYNPNPHGRRVGDCVVRAIAQVSHKGWQEMYILLCLQGLMMSDMPSSNQVWGAYLRSQGYTRHMIPDDSFEYTVEDFCKDNPSGTFVVGTGSHAIAVIDGNYYDAWDSGCEQPIYYFRKDE